MSNNPQKSINVVPAASVVLNSAGTPLIAKSLNIRQCDNVEVQVQIAAIGSMTDLRVHAYVSQLESPTTFAAGGDVDWTRVPITTQAGGLVTSDPAEWKFLKADWFAANDSSLIFRFDAIGQWLTLIFFDEAGVGTSSSVAVDVFLRKGGPRG